MYFKKFLFATTLVSIAIIAIAGYLFFAKQKPALAAGASWYVDNTATGANNGTSWTNSWQSFAAITWSSVQPGDIIYISGGATSKIYAEQLAPATSGVQGNPIAIKVGQDEGHNGIVILDGGAIRGIGMAKRSWITISGQVGSSSTPHMVVKNHTENEVYLNNITGIDIGYIEVGPNIAVGAGIGHCVLVTNGYIGGSNRLHHNKIHNCYDYQVLINQPSGTPSHANYLRIDHNEIYGLGHDGIHLDRTGGITIDHNNIHGAASGANQNPSYIDGMHIRGFQYVTVAYNIIHDLEGPDSMFGYIYFEADTGTQSNVNAHDISIYNNVMYETDHSYNHAGTGGLIFLCKACAIMTNVRILNNTIVDMENNPVGFGTYSADVSDVIVANNIIYNGDMRHVGRNRQMTGIIWDAPGVVGYGSFGDSPTPRVIWDYNLVDIYSSGTIKVAYGLGNGTLYDYATWKTLCGCNAHDVTTTNPTFVNWIEGNAINLHLTSGDTAAKDKGITRTEFNDDYDEIARPQGIAWDIGAYEYIQAPPPLKGDFNSDQKVNNLDFTSFKNAFKSIFNSLFDLNSDNTIDVKDLGVLMSGWLE